MADFFFCPDERSRRIWLKALGHCGRINPETRKRDKELRGLIDVVALPAGGSVNPEASACRILKPLAGFCASPHFAADRGTTYSKAKMPAAEPGQGFLHYLGRLRYHLRTSGTRMTVARSKAFIKKKISGHRSRQPGKLVR